MAGGQSSIKDKTSPPAVEGKSGFHPPRQEKAICSQARLPRRSLAGDNGVGYLVGSIMILRIRAHVQNGWGFFPFFFRSCGTIP